MYQKSSTSASVLDGKRLSEYLSNTPGKSLILDHPMRAPHFGPAGGTLARVRAYLASSLPSPPSVRIKPKLSFVLYALDVLIRTHIVQYSDSTFEQYTTVQERAIVEVYYISSSSSARGKSRVSNLSWDCLLVQSTQIYGEANTDNVCVQYANLFQNYAVSVIQYRVILHL